jgi:hypothetical protein
MRLAMGYVADVKRLVQLLHSGSARVDIVRRGLYECQPDSEAVSIVRLRCAESGYRLVWRHLVDPYANQSLSTFRFFDDSQVIESPDFNAVLFTSQR